MAIPHGQGTANPTFRPSSLDANQVLQYAFDETNCRLRTDATLNLGETEVIIDHENDSIRIGDGTTLTTVTTIGSKSGLDVNVINNEVGGVPSTDNIQTGVAGTQTTFGIPVGTKRLLIRSRLRATIKFAYTAASLISNFITVPPGNTKTIDNISTTGSLTLYFNSTKDNDTLEIEYWE